MNKILFTCTCCLSTIFATTNALAETDKVYVVPPSSSISSPTGPPSISDEEAKVCVELYNEAQWLEEDIEQSVNAVDRSDKNAVNAHNAKISDYRNMINKYNQDCAGKHSGSAQDATDELNQNNQSSP